MGEQSLARLAELALDRHGNYDTLFFEGRWHSSGSLADRAARFATGLAELGLSPGDRLLVLMANCPEVTITYTAAWRAGAVVTPLIFLVSEEELRAALVDSGAVGVVTTAEFLPTVTAAVAGAPPVKFIVCVDVPAAATATVTTADFAEVTTSQPGSIVNRDGSDLAALLYTGGTTGRAKGVPLTHAALSWGGRTVEELGAGAPADSQLISLPLAHAYGLLVLCNGLHRARPARDILMRWFDPSGWVRLAAEHQVQDSAVVPAMIAMLLAEPLEEHDLSALTSVTSGAAPLAGGLRAEFERRLPGCTIYEGYGCTEAATLISANVPGANRPGSVGLPVPGCEVTVQDDDGQIQPAGVDGEICVRSPGVMSGYWHTVPEPADALAGGWLRTGDIGHLDDGYLYIVDRKKDLILRGGFNVFPRDVEDVLVTHPAVSQAGVVGKPDPRLGQEVVAFVCLRPETSATAGELIQYARERLSAAKYPRDIRIVPSLPLTDVLKPDRKQLREWAARG